MLRITIELLPHGDESRAERIAEGVIGNDGTGTRYSGNYDVSFFEKTKDGVVMQCDGRVENFARENLGPWELLYRALGDSLSWGSELSDREEL